MLKRIITIISIVCVAIVAIAAAAFMSAPDLYLPIRDDEDDGDEYECNEDLD